MTMSMWGAIVTAVLILSSASVLLVAAHLHSFPFLKKLAGKSRLLSWLAAVALVLPIGLFAFVNTATMLIVLIHFAIGFLFCDLVFFIIGRIAHKKISKTVRNLTAIILTSVYLAVGWFMANHIFVTRYSLETSKDVGNIRIAQIADAHIGATLDGTSLSRQIERINSYKPDVLVITGDFVDDDTTYDDMVASCRALGEAQTTYGVYYVFGNHDKGYYDSRNFTVKQLKDELSENLVVILEDKSVLIDGRFYIIGRQDRSARNRAAMADLVSGLDENKYSIVLDHQPNDYGNEASAGVDLVLSGHTHGGHIFPAGIIGLLSGANDREYGTEVRGKTTFVVTSGISGWAIPIKTGCYSEFVIIDVNQI